MDSVQVPAAPPGPRGRRPDAAAGDRADAPLAGVMRCVWMSDRQINLSRIVTSSLVLVVALSAVGWVGASVLLVSQPALAQRAALAGTGVLSGLLVLALATHTFRRQQRAARGAETRLDQVLESCPDSVLIIDPSL